MTPRGNLNYLTRGPKPRFPSKRYISKLLFSITGRPCDKMKTSLEGRRAPRVGQESKAGVSEPCCVFIDSHGQSALDLRLIQFDLGNRFPFHQGRNKRAIKASPIAEPALWNCVARHKQL